MKSPSLPSDELMMGDAVNAAVASCSVEDLHMSSQRCIAPEPADPCLMVILGASGDLTERKLVPALYNLYLNGGLPQPFRIVGCARTPMTDEQFREKLRTAIEKFLVL